MQTSVPDLWVDQGGCKLYPIILGITWNNLANTLQIL